MRKTRRGTRLWLVALLLLLLLCSHEATSSSNLSLNTASRSDLHDSSTRREQQHSSGSAANGIDENYASADCSESKGSINPIGSTCPNGVPPRTFPFKPAAARVRGTLSEDAVPDEDISVAADHSNRLAKTKASGSPTLPPPAPTMTAQRWHSRISAVLVLNLRDTPLAKLLMATLRACGGMDIFRDVFVVVPGGELPQIESILQHDVVDDNNSNGELIFQLHTTGPGLVGLHVRSPMSLIRRRGIDFFLVGYVG